jgi:hypothetical protein
MQSLHHPAVELNSTARGIFPPLERRNDLSRLRDSLRKAVDISEIPIGPVEDFKALQAGHRKDRSMRGRRPI